MALIICPECGTPLSEHADKCPGCGCSAEAVRKVKAEKQEKFEEYKAAFEIRHRRIVESAWEYYTDAIGTAAEEFNEKYAAIQEKYEPEEQQLLDQASATKQSLQASQERIRKLSAEVNSTSLFGMGKRKKLQMEIDDLTNQAKEEQARIQAAAADFKSRKSAEIAPIADHLEAVNESVLKEMEEKLGDVSVRSCESADDVLYNYLDKNQGDLAWFLQHMLSDLGMMTEKEMRDHFPYNDNFIIYRVVADVQRKLLHDDNNRSSFGIEQKEVFGEVYYNALSDSVRAAQHEEAMRVLEERIRQTQQRLDLLRTQGVSQSSGTQSTKPASALKRGVAGAVIAGPAGAVIGVGSAINKNITQK